MNKKEYTVLFRHPSRVTNSDLSLNFEYKEDKGMDGAPIRFSRYARAYAYARNKSNASGLPFQICRVDGDEKVLVFESHEGGG